MKLQRWNFSSFQTGLPACEEGKKIVTLLSNDASYLYYRILVETVPGRADGKKFVVLRDIQMFGTTATATPSTGKSRVEWDCQSGISHVHTQRTMNASHDPVVPFVISMQNFIELGWKLQKLSHRDCFGGG